MKTSLLSMLFLCAGLSLSAQETRLTIEVVPGRLGELLTEEQWASVTHLSLTGEMYNSDFYVVRDKPSRLTELDLSGVLADSIPDQAFMIERYMDRIVLPPLLEYIGKEAFALNWERVEIVFTGAYPETTETSFLDSRVLLSVSEDNPYCQIIDGALCSIDGKVLHLAPDTYYDRYGRYAIPDGVETIGKWAFSVAPFICDYLVIPSSVTEIQEGAFAHLSLDHLLSSLVGTPDLVLYCQCSVPPVLGKDALTLYDSHKPFDYLKIPVGSLEAYRSIPEWVSIATWMEESDSLEPQPPVSSDTKEYSFRVDLGNNRMELSADKLLRSVEVFGMGGNLLSRKELSAACSCSLDGCFPENIYLVHIVYEDGSSETVKVAR